MTKRPDDKVPLFLARLGAGMIDVLFIFLIWYWITQKDLAKVDELLQYLDPAVEGTADIFSQAIMQMLVKYLFKYIVVSLCWRCILPAILGNGKTLGKLIFRLSMVDKSKLTEISASRLLLRELARLFAEILVVPMLVSVVLYFCKKDLLHDRIVKTTVVYDCDKKTEEVQ